MGTWPENVGILALELTFPALYVDQTELEVYDGVSSGKYTLGLGQQKMGFCSDREDINSLCLTVVKKLLERNQIKADQIGRLEVGTETIIDKSKSVKSVLMQLFGESTDIEGVDTTNACYGGTAALFNALSWVESSAWDGRLAVVVAGDIAVYAKGSARPTGGAGAIAMLVGPNAPLVLDRGARATCMRHVYDFYKPDLTSEYPTVDGKLSIQCYLSALDSCYQLYKQKAAKLMENIDVNHFDALLFHSPFCKLVEKSLARLVLNDFLHSETKSHFPDLLKFSNLNLSDTYFDKEVEKAFLAFSKNSFNEKTKPSLLIASQVGNMYTPSLYGGLVSLLISRNVGQLAGQKIGLFSYGSGLAASFFSITVTEDSRLLAPLVDSVQHIEGLLQQRQKMSPKDFETCLEVREKNCKKRGYEPASSVENLFPGTYYLTKIDEAFRRYYDRVPLTTNGHV